MTTRKLLSGFVLILVAALLCAPPALRVADAEKDKDRPAELKPLDRWVGQWDMEATMKANEFNPQGGKSTFTSTIKWGINGRFLQCDAVGEGVSGDRKFKDAFTWTCTWDQHLSAYASVTCWANVGGGGDFWGMTDRATGQWDEAAKTLTLKSTDAANGTTMTSVTTWADADNHSFVSRMTDGNGKVVMEMTGKCKRKK